MGAPERETGRLLVVDDDEDIRDFLSGTLPALGFEVVAAKSVSEALATLEARDVDVVLTDVLMAGTSGLELCERLAAARPELPVVVMTAFGRVETAVAALRAGADDFLIKPLHPEAVAACLGRAVERARLRSEVRLLRRTVKESRRFDDLLGDSAAMRAVYTLVDQVAASDASALITGESGTGKELVARALHRRGKRESGPFVAVNCSAMPEALLESELFGHEKGAFTDARESRTGLFVQAHGGTLFLDEIGDLPLGLQPKLLRALEQRSVRPVGGRKEIPFDVRLVAATNRDLESAVEERTFREDLYYRINVIHIELPPLRARGRDVFHLAQHFVERFAGQAGKAVDGIVPGAAEKLFAYGWPGNVRELRNAMERAVALTRHDQITVDDLPEKIRAWKGALSVVVDPAADPAELVPMDEVERRYVLRVLEATAGNKRKAARVLGFDRKTLYRKLERYGVAASASEAEDEA